MEASNNGSLRKEAIRSQTISRYKLANKMLYNSEITFMNHGYYIPESMNSNQENLYLQLFDGIDLTNVNILDVGCGRGGGLKLISEKLNASYAAGVDISPDNIEFCKKHHSNGIDFFLGDAESLPFANETFDIVMNVESAHCYPNYDIFLQEVARVLKPGGFFLSTDIVTDGSEDEVYYSNISKIKEIKNVFEISEKDITDGVLFSCKIDSESAEDWLVRKIATAMVKEYLSGRSRHLSFTCRKIG